MDDSAQAVATDKGPTSEGRQAARDTVWSGGGQIAMAVLGVIWLFTVPRSLGPAEYGVFVLLSSLIDLHSTACCLGVHNAFAYHFPRFRAEGTLAPFAGSYAAVVAAASTLGLGVMVLAAHLLGGAAVTGVMLLAIIATALLQAANTVLGGVLYGTNRIRLYSIRFPLQQSLSLAFILAGWRLWNLEGALVGQALAMGVATVWLLSVVQPWRSYRPALLRWSQMRAPVTFGLLAVFGSLGALSITRGGNIILAGVGRSAAEIGSFAVAVGFVLQGVGLLSGLSAALTPSLAALRAAGEEQRAVDWAARASRYQAILGLLTTAFVALVGKQILQVALGPRFDNVFPITLLSICGMLPLTQTGLANQFAVAWGHPRLNLENWGVLSAVFIVAGGVLAHLYGSLGMAAALVAAAWTGSLYTGLRLRSMGGPDVWSPSVLKLVALALPGVLLVRIEGGWGLSIALFAAFVAWFVLVCFAVRAVTVKDLREVVVSLRPARAPTEEQG